MSRPEIRTIIEALTTYTGQVWSYQDGHFVSPMLSPTTVEGLMRDKNIPATMVPSQVPGELRQKLALTMNTAQDYIDTMRQERGRGGRG